MRVVFHGASSVLSLKELFPRPYVRTIIETKCNCIHTCIVGAIKTFSLKGVKSAVWT